MGNNYNRNRLFIASCLALLVTSLTFAIRARIEAVFTEDFSLTKEQIGYAFGPAFWGFTVAMFVGGMIIDFVKTRTIVWLAFFMHFAGIVVLLMARDMTTLFISNVLIGLGNGSVEAACNPLVAAMYPEKKTTMLNRFHVWFPGGIMIGGLLAFFIIDTMDVSWLILVSLLFIPLFIYGFLFMGQKIPDTERVTSGVSYKDMLKNLGAPITIIVVIFAMILMASVPGLALDFSSNITYIILGAVVVFIIIESKAMNKTSLIFPFLLFCMFLTASSELGTNQWINQLLEGNNLAPILILVMINGIMAVGRFFAGPIVHKLNPVGMLLFSAILTAVGLYFLSVADGAASTIIAAIVFAVGICYFWPTMLGVTNELVPKSGALGLSILGGAGMVATSMVLPIMGRTIESEGAQATLGYMVYLPVILIFCFIALRFMVKGRGEAVEK